MIVLVPEVAHVGEDHRNAVLIGGLDDLFIADTAARLDDGGDTGFGGGFNAIAEGRKHPRPAQCPEVGSSAFCTAILKESTRDISSRADTDGLVTVGENDRV